MQKSAACLIWTEISTFQSEFSRLKNGPFGALIGVALINKCISKTPFQKTADITVGEILIAQN